jgi:ABC-2 type transport system permease protein
VDRLKDDNFESVPLDLTTEGTVPADCELLVVPDPSVPLPQDHLRALRHYLEGPEARMIVMLDSRTQTRGETNLDELLAEYGINVHTDALGMHRSPGLVFARGRLVQVDRAQASVPITGEGYARHDITSDMKNYQLVLIRCAPVEVLNPDPRPGLAARPLLTGVESSWGESNVGEDLEQSTYDAAEDVPGPVVAAAVVEPTAPPQAPPTISPEDLPGPRLVVIGSSVSFVNEAVAQNEPNLYLLLNAVNWSVGKRHMVGIPPKDMDINRVTLSATQMRMSRWIFIGILPAAIVVLGIGVWVVRRR